MTDSSPYTLDSIFTLRNEWMWPWRPVVRPDPVERYYALLERIQRHLLECGIWVDLISGEQTGQGAGTDC